MCNHTSELHDFDEVGTYCLICENYEQSLSLKYSLDKEQQVMITC